MVSQVLESKNVAMSLSFSIIIGEVILLLRNDSSRDWNACREDESPMVSPKLMRTVQHLHDVGRCFCLEYRCLAVHVRFTHLQPSILSVTRYLLACLKFYRTSFAFGVDLFTFYWSLSQFYPRWNSLENYSAIFGTRTRFKSHTSVYARLRIENTLFR